MVDGFKQTSELAMKAPTHQAEHAAAARAVPVTSRPAQPGVAMWCPWTVEVVVVVPCSSLQVLAGSPVKAAAGLVAPGSGSCVGLSLTGVFRTHTNRSEAPWQPMGSKQGRQVRGRGREQGKQWG